MIIPKWTIYKCSNSSCTPSIDSTPVCSCWIPVKISVFCIKKSTCICNSTSIVRSWISRKIRIFYIYSPRVIYCCSFRWIVTVILKRRCSYICSTFIQQPLHIFIYYYVLKIYLTTIIYNRLIWVVMYICITNGKYTIIIVRKHHTIIIVIRRSKFLRLRGCYINTSTIICYKLGKSTLI